MVVIIIFRVIPQTVINVIMPSIGGQGTVLWVRVDLLVTSLVHYHYTTVLHICIQRKHYSL